jgi:hypothetical protein
MHLSKLLVFTLSVAIASPIIEARLELAHFVKDDAGSLKRRKHFFLSNDNFIYKRRYFISLANNS